MHRIKKKKRVIASLVCILISERRQLVKLLKKEIYGSISQEVFLSVFSSKIFPGVVFIDNDNQLSGKHDSQICHTIEELMFQIDQCNFVMNLLVQKKYAEISEILSYIRDKTYILNISANCRRVSSMCSLKEVRILEINNAITLLNQ